MSLDAGSPIDPIDEKPDYLAAPLTNNRPTCRLCEAMYLNGTLRRSILAAYLGRTVTAWPPNYGLDMVAVLRHAWRAQRWERARNVALCGVLLGTLMMLAGRCVARGDERLAAVVVALLLLLEVLRRILRRCKITARSAFAWLWAWRRNRRRLARRGLVLLLLCVGMFGWLLLLLVRLEDLLAALVGGVVLWGIGLVDAYVVAGRARRCRLAYRTLGAPRLRDDVPRMPVQLERGFGALGEGPDPDQAAGSPMARVVVYDMELRHDNPFIGSGQSIWDVEYRVDTHLGRVGKDGKRRRPRPTDMVTLHRTLESSMRQAAVPGLWCGYRMYVDGLGLLNDDVLPDPTRVPVTQQPRDRVLQYLREPTTRRRTYLCVQVPVSGWDNEIIATLFIRGQRIGEQLIMHSKILVLPAMQFRRTGGPKKNPNDHWTQLVHALHFGTTRIWTAALRSPRTLIEDAVAVVRRRWRRWRIYRAVKHGRDLRYGAIDSIREQLAVGGSIFTPNAVQDIKGTIAFLEQTLTKAIREYLVERRIDTSSFDGMVQNIFNQHQNKIDQLNAKNVTFGSKSRAGDTSSAHTESQTSEEHHV
nr:hypothetical protein [Micromonospora sp. DSM 115978]